MKKILFIVALLPFIVKAQSINNQKVRWMQPIYMGSNSVSSANSSSDTGFFFFDRADSVLYFKYKGSARALGYAGSIPNVGQQITDSLRALVRLRASGSGGVQIQNSNGTNVADFGIANTTNGSIAGGWNIGGNLSVTGTSGFTGKATFTDSIVANIIRSRNTAGVSIQNNSGTTIASFGSSGGSTTTLAELSVTSWVSAQTGTFSNILTVSGASNYLSLNNIGYVRSDATGNTLDLQVGTGGLRVMNNGYGTSLLSMTNTGATTVSGALTANGKATFTDSIVGVNQRLTGNLDMVGSGNTLLKITSTSLFPVVQFSKNTSLNWNIEYGRTSNEFGIYQSGGVGGGKTKLSIAEGGLVTVSDGIVSTAQGNNIAVTVDSTTITTSNYTLVAGDAGKFFRVKNGSTALTVTIPANSSVAYPVGTLIGIQQQGTAQITIAGASGVQIESEGSLTKTAAQNAGIYLMKTSGDIWLLVGNRG